MSISFEWDAQKARTNERKHGVAFGDAATAFGDPLSVTVPDPDHSIEEARFVLLGSTYRGTIVVVVHAERDESIRIISARRANRAERRAYEQ